MSTNNKVEITSEEKQLAAARRKASAYFMCIVVFTILTGVLVGVYFVSILSDSFTPAVLIGILPVASLFISALYAYLFVNALLLHKELLHKYYSSK